MVGHATERDLVHQRHSFFLPVGGHRIDRHLDRRRHACQLDVPDLRQPPDAVLVGKGLDTLDDAQQAHKGDAAITAAAITACARLLQIIVQVAALLECLQHG